MALAVHETLIQTATELRRAGWRAEITGEGDLTVAPSADSEHDDYQGELRSLFRRVLRQRPTRDLRVSANLEVMLPRGASRIPDVIVYATDPSWPKENRIAGERLRLVIEVVSPANRPNWQRDLLADYHRQPVPEVWLVHRMPEPAIERLTPSADGYVVAERVSGSQIMHWSCGDAELSFVVDELGDLDNLY